MNLIPRYREKARRRGEEARRTLSMIIDAMSKWKTGIPYWARAPKVFDSKGVPLQYPLTCSKIHGFANIADWHYGGQFEGQGSGCNYMCILLSNLHEYHRPQGHLPADLKLQMDNCAKDNKNHTVLALLALLVQEGVHESIEVSMTDMKNLWLASLQTAFSVDFLFNIRATTHIV